MPMSETACESLSPALFAFHDYLLAERHGLPSKETSEVIADEFRRFFGIPCPMGTYDASTLLNHCHYNDVFLKSGLEKYQHVRGFWDVRDNQVLILLEAARPDPSKIKSLLHEIFEQLLEIEYARQPGTLRLVDKEREKKANKFAAHVKMPSQIFCNAVEMYGLDLPLLSELFRETLAGVSRHIKDLFMPERVFYFGRASLEHHPEQNCSDLLPCIEQSGGLCVYIADAAKTASVNARRRRGGALPFYNVARKAQFRVMHPRLHSFEDTDDAAKAPPYFISRLRAGSGFGCSQLELDLLESQDLAVMIFPIGKRRRLSGFFIAAVHFRDACLFNKLRDRILVSRQDDMEWIFSWEKEEYVRVPEDDLEVKLSGQTVFDLFNDENPNADLVRWPLEGSPLG